MQPDDVPPPPADFDEFYVASRRRLLLQTFALTGDLTAARQAVRQAFVQARHHWRKVCHLDDPESWVRPRAWAIAQRRSAAHIGHREKGLTPEQGEVLSMLDKLPERQRKALLLTHLASLSLTGIGRELGETRHATEHLLQHAATTAVLALDCDASAIRGRLEDLATAITSHGLPRASVIRRSGRRRQRVHTAVGAVAAIALTVGMGAFVTTSQGAAAPHSPVHEAHPATRAMLLKPYELTGFKPASAWRIRSTTDNTHGSGLNTVCQGSRFADPRGMRTLVRSLVDSGNPPRTLVQTVEVSETPGAASKAYATTVKWYSNCKAARSQLVRSYRVSGIGHQAQAFKLRVPGKRTDGTYVVGISRSGRVTLTTVLHTDGTRLQSVRPLLRVLSGAMQNLCQSDDVKQCRAGTPEATPVLPPRSGEAPGMLATADLPPVGRVGKQWVGTEPSLASPNLAATTCDRADFVKAGAIRPTSRTFLIPEAHLPKRFGMTESVGRFTKVSTATSFFDSVAGKLDSCEDRQLGSTVTDHFKADGLHHSRLAMWRVGNEINDKRDEISYWMGIVQIGHRVAQVNFAPVPRASITADQFRDLIARARDRLLEVTPPGGRS